MEGGLSRGVEAARLRFGSPEERAIVFLSEYGERGKQVLEAALEAWRRAQSSPRPPLGDFDYRGLVEVLRERGIEYKPNQLLRRLERDYDLIETSYRSSSQHWWVFRDREALERALYRITSPRAAGEVEEDPVAKALRIRYASLEPRSLRARLESFLERPRLTLVEKDMVREIIDKHVERAGELLAKMRRHDPEAFGEEVRVLEEILGLASQVVEKHFSR